MDLLREIAPFLIGMIVPPIIMLGLRTHWSGRLKFTVTFLTALVLGICTSALAGELVSGPPDNLISILIDTSLVYMGSQVAYRFFWKAALEARLVRNAPLVASRTR